jgi:hypothetical protein
VLVIESGEIELPSKCKGLRNIGLPPDVIYACLAETITLALEGRFEVFTIGRDTEWEKVKEIYKLGLKHGMKLAAIAGVGGAYTDEDIARVVELAKNARKTWKPGKAAKATKATKATKAATATAPRKTASAPKPVSAKKAQPAKKVAAGKKRAPSSAAPSAVKAPARKRTRAAAEA